ncbi:hypothetical protein MASR1M101_11280 [Gemmatimonas sp.]
MASTESAQVASARADAVVVRLETVLVAAAGAADDAGLAPAAAQPTARTVTRGVNQARAMENRETIEAEERAKMPGGSVRAMYTRAPERITTTLPNAEPTAAREPAQRGHQPQAS